MNNEDRELLGMAAKAAGYEFTWVDKTKNIPAVSYKAWNPLADDGDALRLAVKLCLTIDVDEFMPQTTVSRSPIRNVRYISLDEQHNQDSYAATRRAIVRAAAEIGKTTN